MSEKRIINILKSHGVQVCRFAGKLWAIEEYSWIPGDFIAPIHCTDPVIIDPEAGTVDGIPVFWYLGY